MWKTTVASNKIVGLAFVLYEDEPVLRQMDGMQNVYKVSSFYNSDTKTVHHVRSFRSFPSTDHFTSCFRSTILKQILQLKSKIQQALNMRSVRSNNSVTVIIDNFSSSTWDCLTSNLCNNGIFLSRLTAIIKSAFMERDSYVVQKFHGEIL
jgi:hypothetical protein